MCYFVGVMGELSLMTCFSPLDSNSLAVSLILSLAFIVLLSTACIFPILLLALLNYMILKPIMLFCQRCGIDLMVMSH